MDEFQTVDVAYPKFGYFSAVWMKAGLTKDSKYFPHISNFLFTNQEDAMINAKRLLDNPKFKKTLISDMALFAKLEFLKHVPLKKEYWKITSKPPVLYSVQRTTDLLQAADPESDFIHLISPLEKKVPRFSRFLITDAINKKDIKKVPEILKNSDMPVWEKAKNAALYKSVDSFGYNFKTNQKIKDGVSYWEN